MNIRNLALSAMLSSVLLVSSAFAANASANGSAEKNAISSVKSQIATALSGVATSGEVEVLFRASSDKGFEVVNVSGENSKLVKKVKDRLVKEKVEVSSELNGSYTLKVKFYDEDSYVNRSSPEDALRTAIACALSKVTLNEQEDVTVIFSVKDNVLKVLKVIGDDKSFSTAIEKSINGIEVKDSEKLSGVYKVKVNFADSF